MASSDAALQQQLHTLNAPELRHLSVSFSVISEFKALVEVAAACEQRSRTNLLEELLDHCQQHGVLPASTAEKKTMRRET